MWERDYTTVDELWFRMVRHWRSGEVRTIDELYAAAAKGGLRAGDLEADKPGGTHPRWKRNVRNALQGRKGQGDVIWVGRGIYEMP